jgi:hypothetical protein
VATRTLSIVIDADIARSSGTSEHPVSSNARKLLNLVQSEGHCIVMCPMLREEWKKHQSGYATRWLSSMVAKKQVRFITHKSELQLYIETNVADIKLREIAMKDAHLVEAAFLESKIIASNDVKARDAFCEISLIHRILEQVIWLHSITDNDFIKNYLSKSCFVPTEKFLKKLGEV